MISEQFLKFSFKFHIRFPVRIVFSENELEQGTVKWRMVRESASVSTCWPDKESSKPDALAKEHHDDP